MRSPGVHHGLQSPEQAQLKTALQASKVLTESSLSYKSQREDLILARWRARIDGKSNQDKRRGSQVWKMRNDSSTMLPEYCGGPASAEALSRVPSGNPHDLVRLHHRHQLLMRKPSHREVKVRLGSSCSVLSEKTQAPTHRFHPLNTRLVNYTTCYSTALL